ncbi:MAG: sulfatase [Candidatus Coatesbacteria bacterium]|nr:MAG: sulfatase [Candidatus Coatesbacteria bacterium]
MNKSFSFLKIAAAYGLALSAVETLIMLAGHGAQAPAGARAAVYAATVVIDTLAAVILALALYGGAIILGKLLRVFRSRSAQIAEIGFVAIILGSYAVLIIRSKLVPGLPVTHPYKLGAFAACGVGALAVALGWRAIRKKLTRRWVLIATAAASVVAGAVLFALPEIKGAARPKALGPDVIFVSLDTVRADHLGCYGYDRNTSPNIDTFAREAVIYENAICVQPTTNPSHVSMFTGLYPAEHGTVSNFVPMHTDAPTISEILAARGYETAAVTGGFPLDRRLSNLGAGFRFYDDYIKSYSYFRHTLLYRLAVVFNKTIYGALRSAPAVTAAAVKILNRRRDRPLFLFVHYFDPHHPYEYHGAARRFYDGAEPVDFETRERDLRRRWQKYEKGSPRPKFAPAIEALYDDEIFYMDEALGDLFAELRGGVRYDQTLIVVTSDHGESFAEHGHKYHGGTVYDPETRVCLLIKPAAVGLKGRRVPAQVETLGLAYTLLEATGAPTDTYRGKRLDLLAARDRPEAPPAWGFSQTNTKSTSPAGYDTSRAFCLRTAEAKLIFDLADQRYEYYDLTTDPAERRNVYAQIDASAYEDYRRELDRHIKRTTSSASGPVGGDLADALKALGYTN